MRINRIKSASPDPEQLCSDLIKLMRVVDTSVLPMHYVASRKMLKNFTKKWVINTRKHYSPLYDAILARIEEKIAYIEADDVAYGECVRIKEKE